MPTLSVVVPFHNEESNVTELYSRLQPAMQGLEWSDQFTLVVAGRTVLANKPQQAPA